MGHKVRYFFFSLSLSLAPLVLGGVIVLLWGHLKDIRKPWECENSESVMGN